MSNNETSLKQQFMDRKHRRAINKLVKEHNQLEGLTESEIARLMCIEDIDPITSGIDAGYYTIFNRTTCAQAFLIGVNDKFNQLLKGFSQDYDLSTIDRVLNRAKTDGASVILSHNIITLTPTKKNKVIKSARNSVEAIKARIRRKKTSTSDAAYNTENEKKLNEHTSVTLNGIDTYFSFAMVCVVLSPSRETVDEVVGSIRNELNIGGIRTVIPRYAQLNAIKLALPTNVVPIDFFKQYVNGRTVAAMLPLRRREAAYNEEGVIFFDDADTGYPIKISGTVESSESTFIVGPPGSGKTTDVCYIARNALARGDHVHVVEPKGETNKERTDYLNFFKEFGGSISLFGPGGINPCPFIIPYNKKLMGTNPITYVKAKDDWIDVIDSVFGAWTGDLNPRQSGFLMRATLDLWVGCGVIQRDGTPINTELWDVPGALAWPSVNDCRSYMWTEYCRKGSEYYKDPSIKALYDKTSKAMEGGNYWWWANSHEHLILSELMLHDIHNVPDSLKPAIMVQILGTLNTLYYPAPEDGKRHQTYVILDEVATLIETPQVVPFIGKALREGRAPGITVIPITQHPVMPKSFVDMVNASCKNLVVMNNLDDKNVDIFMDAFHISEEYRSELMQQGYGKGVWFHGNSQATRIKVNIDEDLQNVLFNSRLKESEVSETRATERGFSVREEVRKIYEDGFFVIDWLVSKPMGNYPGFKYYNPIDPLSRGGHYAAYLKESKIKEIEGMKADGTEYQDRVGPEGVLHFIMVSLIAGWMMLHGYPNVKHILSGGPDITWGEGENKGCLEYEIDGTHNSIEAWNKKLERARKAGFKNIIFTGTGAVCEKMTSKEESIVIDYVFPQGAKFLLTELERIAAEIKERGACNPHVNFALVEQAEA